MMAKKMDKGITSEEELKRAFAVFDKDGNGMISADELRHVMSNLGEKLTEEEVTEMIKEADKDGDGQINYTEMKEVFSLFDKDRDGVVDISEIGAIIRSLGLNPTQEEINNLVDTYEDSGNGQIDYVELMTIVARMRLEPQDTEESLREAFRSFDNSRNGVLSLEELQDIMTRHGEKLTEEEMKEMLEDTKEVLNDEGHIRYDGN
ncbi:hypothetical protein KUTeg_013211 [Tegillarca granosa]|uniref:EF-hand domain-containing protein n=1 Tax=Tegillarca granosa TaxID=220873 RepID=A0ABQ9EXJ0_TEGGR|nr:hypothetical protein KUTeg_013211 [Tegillarca granosa]